MELRMATSATIPAASSIGTNTITVANIGATETTYDVHNTNGDLVIIGNGQVFLYDTKTRKRKSRDARSGLNSLGSEVFSPDGKRVLFSHSGPAQPNDLCVSGAGLPRPKSARITNSMLAGMDPAEMVEPYLLKIGFVTRAGTRGRRATRDAYLHLGKEPPASAPGQAGLFE